LLGLAIALKLTPAVFLLYFALRRDGRAVVTSLVSFLVATAAGFALAWHDSVQYWTSTVRNTDRIGGATLNTNQNIAGALARLGIDPELRFLIWTAACLVVLAVTIWAVRRVLAAGEPMLALVCVALFGLVVSPVSWSHHWVWVLPTVVVGAVLAYRRRSTALAVVTALGVALTVFMPFELMPTNHEPAAALWRQLAGLSYVWWALAVIVVCGFAARPKSAEHPRAAAVPRPVSSVVS
jgi:alpha-1,2-mannosyltransferase